MQTTLARGHVYKITDNVYGVVSFYPKTEVFVRVLADNVSETEACEILSREFAGAFVVADSDTRKWGETIVQRIGYYRGL